MNINLASIGMGMKSAKIYTAAFFVFVLLVCRLSCAGNIPGDGYTAADEARLEAVRLFADNVLEKGRDRWSGKNTPLLADGINVLTGEPVTWRFRGTDYIIHNLASQQNLFRVLEGLTALTGQSRYRAAAEEAVGYHFTHLLPGCGKLRWGGHQFIDLATLAPVGHFDADCHEFKVNFPHYRLMWSVDATATARFLRALWRGHIMEWRTLALNRHARYGSGPPPEADTWEGEFADPEPFFESTGLSFLNCGADLVYGAGMLYALGGEAGALTWALRLAGMYRKARHPETGMGAYQFTRPRRRRDPPADGPLTGSLTVSSYGDRMENKFAGSGSDEPGDEFYNPVKGRLAADGLPVAREGWAWSASGGFPWYALALVHLSETIGADAAVLVGDAADHLEAHLRHAYDPEKNHFRPMWADGTDVSGLRIPRTGYGPGRRGDPYEPAPATPAHLLACLRAFRLSGRTFLWESSRAIARGLGLGDIGARPGHQPTLEMPGAAGGDALLILALIEMDRAGAHPAYLDLARRLADRVVARQFHDGFFLSGADYLNARFDAVEPLALLALDATLRGAPEKVPAYIGGRGYIHGRFDGHGRTYDSRVIWNRRRPPAGEQ